MHIILLAGLVTGCTKRVHHTERLQIDVGKILHTLSIRLIWSINRLWIWQLVKILSNDGATVAETRAPAVYPQVNGSPGLPFLLKLFNYQGTLGGHWP